MRLGLSTYTYTWAIGVPGAAPREPLTAHGLLDRAVELGVPVVQFADNLPLESARPEDLERLARHARAAGIGIELGTRGIGPGPLRRYLAIAQALGSGLLRTVTDTPGHRPSPREVAETLAPMRAEFRRAGVTLAIENHDRFTSAELRQIITAIGTDWAGVCLDTVNSFGALEGPGVVVETLAPLAVNVHVKDFVITRAWHQMGFIVAGCPAGQGRLDIPWLLSAIGRHRGDVTAVLELWTPPEPAVEDTIAKERSWAQSSIGFLRDVLDRSATARSGS